MCVFLISAGPATRLITSCSHSHSRPTSSSRACRPSRLSSDAPWMLFSICSRQCRSRSPVGALALWKAKDAFAVSRNSTHRSLARFASAVVISAVVIAGLVLAALAGWYVFGQISRATAPRTVTTPSITSPATSGPNTAAPPKAALMVAKHPTPGAWVLMPSGSDYRAIGNALD